MAEMIFKLSEFSQKDIFTSFTGAASMRLTATVAQSLNGGQYIDY